jgi:hypothetical protein
MNAFPHQQRADRGFCFFVAYFDKLFLEGDN